MAKIFLLAGTIGGFLSVTLGAFAAHELKKHLTVPLLNTFKVAVEYQFYHSLALILIALTLLLKPETSQFQTAGWFIVAGIILFSGSLYTIALTNNSAFGPVTPLGGVFLLIGWFYFIWGAWKAF